MGHLGHLLQLVLFQICVPLVLHPEVLVGNRAALEEAVGVVEVLEAVDCAHLALECLAVVEIVLSLLSPDVSLIVRLLGEETAHLLLFLL